MCIRDSAYGNLKAAIDQLVLRGDVSELENEIILAEKLVENAVIGTEAVSYTHLDVYKRQDMFIAPLK